MASRRFAPFGFRADDFLGEPLPRYGTLERAEAAAVAWLVDPDALAWRSKVEIREVAFGKMRLVGSFQRSDAGEVTRAALG